MKSPQKISLLIIASLLSALTLADGHKSGGDTTITISGANAFSQPSANMSLVRKLDFGVGNSFFRNPWVAAPASTEARDGLGPLFNTNGCQNCHIKDGRGHPKEPGDENAVSMLVRLSIPATKATRHLLEAHGNIPEPTYGGQLQDFALPGHQAEGQIELEYKYRTVRLKGGEKVELRKPILRITDLGYGPMHRKTMTSIRMAQPMIGLGLLEAIPDSTLETLADPNDKNRDGISGRLNRVWDSEQQKSVYGRFGWKAGQPSVMQQNAAAFNGDLGLTSNLFPKDDCTDVQTNCLQQVHGGTPEVSDKILGFVQFYTRNLAVPSRRNMDNPVVQQGEQLFIEIGCNRCHVEQHRTAVLENQPEQSNQIIHPYTDLLLHDMGKGLADKHSEFEAKGSEWRTPPLWGIGYTQEVSGHTFFLHDGRARNLKEAILWHSGEAKNARKQFSKLEPEQREALIRFLESL